MRSLLLHALSLAAALFQGASAYAHAPMAADLSAKASASAGFEENKGQVRTTNGEPAPFVRYRFTQGNTSIFLLGSGIAYQFNRMHYPEGYTELMADPSPGSSPGSLRAGHDPQKQRELDAVREKVRLETYRMDMLLEGANPNARITTEGKSSDYTQYYTHDALDVRTYGRITYHDVYPGIDWVLYTTAKGIKYDFVVHPGADPDRIRLRFKDHEELYVGANGDLVHGNRMGRFTEERPVSFQGNREVPTRFALEGNTLRFAMDSYDPSRTLIIDPDRIWGTYYGGEGGDIAFSTTVDAGGNVYLAGMAASATAIAQGGYQNTGGGGNDAFLVKFDGNGVRQWATYYGGEGYDQGRSCAVDGLGNVYLAGTTGSTTAIATGGHQNTFGGGGAANGGDAFLVKFDGNGQRLWGTYYGGADYEDGYSCAVDGMDNVFLAGTATSPTSIALAGHQNTGGGGDDAFLVKFDGNGQRLWGTYYGGADSDYGASCAVDGIGNVYLAGTATSATAIASAGHQNTFGGGDFDAFLVKFDGTGLRLWGTYYGDNGQDLGWSCAVDNGGNVYLAGRTRSTTAGIASGGHQNTFGGGTTDAFLVKFDGTGLRQWGTYYGDVGADDGYACTVDGIGNVYLAGETTSSSAIAIGGHQNTYGGSADAFLVMFTETGVLQWGTYYGGGGRDQGLSCAVDGSGNAYLAGFTSSTTDIAFGGHQNSHGGGQDDAFLVKFNGSESKPDGINTISGGEGLLSAWPNPARDVLRLSRPVDGLVIDATGRMVRAFQRETTVALEGMAPGVYLLRTNEGMVVRFVRE